MSTFQELNLNKQLLNGLEDMGYTTPTPIQSKAYPVIASGKDMVGIAQTGTGKTYAYLLPILKELKFTKQLAPRVLILVPTRELVLQVVENINTVAKYISIRAKGVYGGTNINSQAQEVAQGCDVLVATPGRLYDLAIARLISMKSIHKLVVDEVDVMLDLGFLPQLTRIFDLLPERRQNVLFSATMTDEVDVLIDEFFTSPTKIAIAVSGTPLDNIEQKCYPVHNFYTKANLLKHLLKDRETFKKVLVFTASKKQADRLFEIVQEMLLDKVGVIHSNKSQNYRIRSITEFDEGKTHVLITTDIMARGLDLNEISHVINIDTPSFPENYMHRIGRTGRAEKKGTAILFHTEKEQPAKAAIEELMDYETPMLEFPEEVEINYELTPEERPKKHRKNIDRPVRALESGPGTHEKKAKNKKENLGGSYRRELAAKYKKPRTRGDKRVNNQKKKKK